MILSTGEVQWLGRKRAGLTQTQYAQTAGVSQSYYSRIERDTQSTGAHYAVTTKEAAQILKRRLRKTAAQIGREMELSKATIHCMINRGDARLMMHLGGAGICRRGERLGVDAGRG